MTEPDEWSKKQTEPLGIFDLANKWAEALKVLGTGNGAGLVAAGVSLSSFSKNPPMLPFIKLGGVCFFVGVITFAIAFALVQLAIFSYDEMLHAVRGKSPELAHTSKTTSSSAMVAANRLAIVSALAFFVGIFLGLIAFLKA
ncbi:hypothetical protein BSZ21_10240 [Bradyrhizobium canariense]|uniref:hypothetical protein n=1 Tax=Bradyrhizobium canariense TaxID=255045 RepID=UPI000A190B52|nr:hypothetical protein [Bradyrhizobium canariense]OSI70980.1 hypothetical protein BSZ21_10240 [Bradyrhizobium canariense]